MFIYTNSEIEDPFLDNVPRDECYVMLVEVYNSKVRLMRASTDFEESKEDSSEPPSKLNEGFIAYQEIHQSAIQIKGPAPR